MDELIQVEEITVERVSASDGGPALVDLRVVGELTVSMESDEVDGRPSSLITSSVAAEFTVSTTFDPETGQLDATFSADPIELDRDEIMSNGW